MKGFTKVTFALLGSAAAQTTTVVEVVNPYFGNNPYDASVVDANPTATTYAVYCQKNSTNYQCRDDPAGLVLTLVGGPSTVEVHIERPKSELSTEFIGTISGDQLDYQEVVTKSGKTVMLAAMVLSPVTNSDARVPLTITAGIEKLQAQATATAAATTQSSGAQTGPTATGTQASPTSTPNAAVLRADQKGRLAGFAGAAAAVAVMLF
ncbi:hypothetical protein ColTof4_02340 [Colletotrichum tofieldiae]|uniref:GPI anchored protein n=1 Tax=Colletotrichum tofieldiae TaxID=708197 RepID=A0A166UUD1_9PEZI|nr:hypothetical protein CT0861_02962 [Colletotrichum tofieldiae]GKT62032.1 hypothetical protein ColTof3_09371 [Colletotrichum tofieldiae]GKT69917.1 hypothetical protein ColTof4_02340 [Colletotrichum tofieldiae]GKT92935.1 hypothetical protein Ct61P_10785 [Colletotrichum tofieldiae]